MGSTAADDHRLIAGAFTDRVCGVPAAAWDDPAPVEGWVARDVVRHLVTWLPAFLESGAGIVLPTTVTVDEDPVEAWQVQRDAVQALLDDPQTAASLLSNLHLGQLPLESAVASIYTTDVFLHTWDLARATGQDDSLDPARCQTMLDGMQPLDEVLRSSGQYGPRVVVPDDAAPQAQLLGFIGRDPSWAPPSPASL